MRAPPRLGFAHVSPAGAPLAVAAVVGCAFVLGALAPRAAAQGLGFTSENLPAGGALERSVPATPEQVASVAARLDAAIASLTTQIVSVRGLRAQANVLACSTEPEAERLERALRAVKGDAAWSVGRSGLTVIEIVRAGPLFAKRLLACLGALPEGPAIYEARFRVACLDELDYMEANEVFQAALAEDAEAGDARIRALTADWRPGASLALWTGRRAFYKGRFVSEPTPATVSPDALKAADPTGDLTRLAFATPLPTRAGLPYVEVTGRIEVRNAYTPGEGPTPHPALTAATPRWPAADPAARALAARLTNGCATPLARVDAILAHVFEAIRYDGPQGTRYGPLRVLEQGFGRCWDKSDALITLCRAAGIPARQIAGWVPALGAGHVWAEVHIADAGWLPVDATTPWVGTSDDYVPWFSSSDGEMPIVYLALPVVKRLPEGDRDRRP